ncbi:MAG: hypothetical protein J6K20_15200 [Thermoguttaceae bacterium]|nr:hypothetical protein [Thermoguttaceae bacterium]
MNAENELIKKLRIINKRNPALWNSVVAYINGANAALECGVRQVAPSAVASVALPETETVAPESPVALPEASPVESQAVAPSSPTYRLVLNVPEIGLKGFAD